MSFFNDKRIDAMMSGRYICDQCGSVMEWEDEWEDSLICPNCGNSVNPEKYGFSSDEEYEALFPTEKDVLGADDDDETPAGERYDEVCGELDDYTPPWKDK